MIINKKSILSLLLLGCLATSTVQAGFWTKEEPSIIESITDTIGSVIKRGKKIAKSIYKYKKILAATGIIGALIIKRITDGSQNAFNDFIDGGVDAAAGVAS